MAVDTHYAENSPFGSELQAHLTRVRGGKGRGSECEKESRGESKGESECKAESEGGSDRDREGESECEGQCELCEMVRVAAQYPQGSTWYRECSSRRISYPASGPRCSTCSVALERARVCQYVCSNRPCTFSS